MLNSSQRSHLRAVIAEVKAIELDVEQDKHRFQLAVLAVMTAFTESNMSVYASANVPSSITIPHDPVVWEPDGLGHDHASLGLYQQQTGTAFALPGTTTMTTPKGWGAPLKLMDPAASTELFVRALLRRYPFFYTVSGGGTRPLVMGAICQAVQGSAYPDRYESQWARAHKAVRLHWHTVLPADERRRNLRRRSSSKKMLKSERKNILARSRQNGRV